MPYTNKNTIRARLSVSSAEATRNNASKTFLEERYAKRVAPKLSFTDMTSLLISYRPRNAK